MLDMLKDKIEKDGIVIDDDILKVDSFINHQIDIALLDEIGKYFAGKFTGVNKILTIEASGIAFAVGTSYHFGKCPVVFAKKTKSRITNDNVYSTIIHSYTHGNDNNVTVDKRFLNKNDKVLIVDDFMADGNSAVGLVKLCQQAGASVVGVAIVVEKGFQNGRQKVEELGIRVESAAIVDRFENGKAILK